MAFGLVESLVFIASIFLATYFLKKDAKEAMEKKPIQYPNDLKIAFAAQFREDALHIDMKGIPIDMALTVAALETGWGTGNVFRKTNSYFNILATGWARAKYDSPNGLSYRVYNSRGESIQDFVRLMQIPHYSRAYQAAINRNLNGFVLALEDAGYAGPDKQYAQKLLKVALGVV